MIDPNPLSNMSFWDHVDDFRQTLIEIFGIVLLAFILVFAFHAPILNFFLSSWQSSQNKLMNHSEIQFFRITNEGNAEKLISVPRGAKEKSIGIETDTINLKPGESVDYSLSKQAQLLFLGPTEGLSLTFKLSFWLALTLTTPFWGWRLLRFILPGLNAQEKRLAVPFLTFSFVFALGAFFVAHYFTIPIANNSLATFNAAFGQNAWSFSHYIDYTLLIYLGHVVAFELALLLLMATHYGLLTYDHLRLKRRYVYVGAFVLGALLTPPDALTQVMLAIPLIGIYELAILYSRAKSIYV